MKALVAQFIFESNTFNPQEAELEIFTAHGVWAVGEPAVRSWIVETPTQLSGSVEELKSAGWDVHPLLAVCGTPAGRLSASAFAQIRDVLKSELQSHFPADAILLHLHGAACAVGEDDTEGNLLEMVRIEMGFVGRLVLSLDLHANVTQKMVRHADAITAYRTMPHTDFVETGRRAARFVTKPIQTQRTLAKIAALIPPTGTNDRNGPFAEVLLMARALEEVTGIIDVSIFPTQPWMNVAEMGSSIVVTSLAGSSHEEDIRQFAEFWYGQRFKWQNGVLSWEDICQKLAQPATQPWILADVADATTGGAAGGSAEALRQLWKLRYQLSGRVLLHVVDLETIAAAARGEHTFHLGNERFLIEARVVYLGDMRYRARGKSYHGIEFSHGPAAVLEAGQLTIVVCSSGALCADPAFYECLGLKPTEALAVQVKSLMGWKTGYEVSWERGLLFDSGGITTLDFATLPFDSDLQHLYPLTHTTPQPVILWPFD